MKAYKGFEPNLTCRGFQYEEGKTYKEEIAKICRTGFHACERPIDTFRYYRPNLSVYHEVDIDDSEELDRDRQDSKVCSKKITIGKQLNLYDFVTAEREYAIKNGDYCHENRYQEKKYKVVESKDRAMVDTSGTAITGMQGVSVSGDQSIAYTGILGIACAGQESVARADTYGIAIAKEFGTAISGHFGISIAKETRGSAGSGNNGIAIARKYAKVGDNGIIILYYTDQAYVIGGMNSMIIVTLLKNQAKIFRIDGEQYKPNVLYYVSAINEEEVTMEEARYASYISKNGAGFIDD